MAPAFYGVGKGYCWACCMTQGAGRRKQGVRRKASRTAPAAEAAAASACADGRVTRYHTNQLSPGATRLPARPRATQRRWTRQSTRGKVASTHMSSTCHVSLDRLAVALFIQAPVPPGVSANLAWFIMSNPMRWRSAVGQAGLLSPAAYLGWAVWWFGDLHVVFKH